MGRSKCVLKTDEHGNKTQQFGSAPWDPLKLQAKLAEMARKSGCKWSSRYSAHIAKKGPNEGACMLHCKKCKQDVSPANISASVKSHDNACKGLKRPPDAVNLMSDEDEDEGDADSPAKHTRAAKRVESGAFASTSAGYFVPSQQAGSCLEDFAMFLYTAARLLSASTTST
eukprot:350286-Chlamydomonas_euryale.AAC.1